MGESFRDELSRLQEQIQNVHAHLERLRHEEQDLTRRIEAAPLIHPDLADSEGAKPAEVDLPLHSKRLSPAKAAALHRLLVDDRVDRRVDDAPSARPEPTEVSPPVAIPVAIPELAERVRSVDRLKLEQQLGTHWLGWCGLIVILLAAIIGMQYVLEHDWVPVAVQLALMAAAGLVLTVASEPIHRTGKPTLATGITAAGMALLYLAVCTAGSDHLSLLSSPVAFAGMCAVTALGVAIGLRRRVEAPVTLAAVGAYLTLLLVPVAPDAAAMTLPYILAADVIFLIIAATRQWRTLPPLALAGTLGVSLVWCADYYSAALATEIAAFAWSVVVLFGAFAVAGSVLGWLHRIWAMVLVAAAATAMIVLHGFQSADLPAGAILAQWFLLDVLVLGLCLWRGFDGLRPAVLVWTVLGIAMVYMVEPPVGDVWFWCGWIWAFYGLATLDILAGFARKPGQFHDQIDTTIVITATSLMALTTYSALAAAYPTWLGSYVMGLAVCQVALWLVVRRMPGRSVLAMVYLTAALVLFVIAAPIQFELASASVVWAVMSVAAMLLARLLVSRLMLATAITLLILAAVRLFATDALYQAPLTDVMATVGGVGYTGGMVLSILLATSAVLCASLLSGAQPIYGDRDDPFLSYFLLWAGALLWGTRTALELPVVVATWWWLALTGFVALLAAGPRAGRLYVHATAMLAATAAKHLLFDTAVVPLAGTPVLRNIQAGAAVALAAGCVLAARRFGREADRTAAGRQVQHLLVVFSAVILVWGGTLEIARYFAAYEADLAAGVGRVGHLACSLWWLMCAMGLLGFGLLRRIPSLRYLSLTLLALAAAKVLVLDLFGLAVGYRMALLVLLGATMVFASRLYRHYMHTETEIVTTEQQQREQSQEG